MRCRRLSSLLLTVLLLCTLPVLAADPPKNLANPETPVTARCVSADGTTFESCGGGGVGGGDGAILDGVSSSIKATVFDFTNSNPLGVVLRDTNGDYVSVGGGTQYTEDVPAVADPVGTQVNCRRRDTLASETTTDGDNTAANCTAKGEVYVKHVDTVTVSGTLTVSNSFLLDATYTGRTPAGASPADNESNTNTALSRIGVFNYVFDGAAWDRWTGAVTQSGTWNITNISGTVSLPTGASTLAEQQTQTTSLQLIDDVVNAANSALSKVAAIGCQFDDTTPGTVTENNVSPVRCSTRREVYTQIRDAAGNERGANVDTNNNLQVSETGRLTDNGAAATSNRIASLPATATATYTAETSGRDEALKTGTLSGNLFAAMLPEPSVASYSAAAVVSSAASATDISVIPGNATNTVLVTELRVSCTQTTAGIIELHIIKRTTADTGGTSAGMTEVPDDANYAAASSALLTYTANPTINSTVGDVDIVKLGCMATGTTSPNDIYIGNWRQKPMVLRGTAQQLALNLNGVTVTGGSFALAWKWIETTGP